MFPQQFTFVFTEENIRGVFLEKTSTCFFVLFRSCRMVTMAKKSLPEIVVSLVKDRQGVSGPCTASGTSIQNYGGYDSILCIFGKVIFISI